LNCKFFN